MCKLPCTFNHEKLYCAAAHTHCLRQLHGWFCPFDLKPSILQLKTYVSFWFGLPSIVALYTQLLTWTVPWSQTMALRPPQKNCNYSIIVKYCWFMVKSFYPAWWHAGYTQQGYMYTYDPFLSSPIPVTCTVTRTVPILFPNSCVAIVETRRLRVNMQSERLNVYKPC